MQISRATRYKRLYYAAFYALSRNTKYEYFTKQIPGNVLLALVNSLPGIRTRLSGSKKIVLKATVDLENTVSLKSRC